MVHIPPLNLTSTSFLSNLGFVFSSLMVPTQKSNACKFLDSLFHLSFVFRNRHLERRTKRRYMVTTHQTISSSPSQSYHKNNSLWIKTEMFCDINKSSRKVIDLGRTFWSLYTEFSGENRDKWNREAAFVYKFPVHSSTSEGNVCSWIQNSNNYSFCLC